ncbi:sialate O-acetylesterase [Aquimarina sp. D1M17]|uniref:sialate O-acetylesterase n=1 Tax=Aquimarina acroporae TaxID=2937283 RepID=UPI0020C03BE4|nr:sialate O-acetylesterase [Aquimarina acroporae]MCK8523009.1 sialate O-acetylesterase [Aquimarina acroporae]
MMMLRPFILILLIFVFYPDINGYSQDSNFHVYLCFGQSNMEGQGIIALEDKEVSERFVALQTLDCPEQHKTKGEWYKAIPPLCQCTSGLSPADYFGRTMVAKLPDSIKVGVINVAIGGCDIRLFDKDIFKDYDTTYKEDWFVNKVAAYQGNPYQYLINLAKEAQKDGVIKGILLHQGETNTGDPAWPQYVKKIYENMLADLSLDKNAVPLLAGEVVAVKNSCCSSMNSIINTLPNTVQNAHIISSKNCTAQDNAHFDAEGYREMGRRYANKMLTLLSN